MTKFRLFQAGVCLFIVACIWLLIRPVDAWASATCANVRCSSGTCIDTPSGPTCTQTRLTCASTLCREGTTCVETHSGPQCVPNDRPYNYSGYNPHPSPYVRPYQSWRRHYQPRRHYNAYKHYSPLNPYGYRNGSHHGYGYGHGHYTPRPQPKPPTYGGGFCTKEYRPVCAQKRVQCFRAPCPPVQQTFGNACEARNAGYTVISNGVCNSYK